MKNNLKWLGYGFLTWLVPFIVAFGFYDQQGNLQTSYGLFKSTMIVVSSIIGSYILFLFFKQAQNDFVRKAVAFGVFLLLINWILDFLILIPMSKMSFSEYFQTIGLAYLQIPVYTITIGLILNRKLA
ncbi:MAG: hypothetical protein RIA63_06690 [Cyclobacteriaceae bacterium]